MRRTDYKVDRIKLFIQTQSPTKSELIEHIAVDINKKVSRKIFQARKRDFRGYYCTNIQTMRRAGNITSKNGRYVITPQGLKNENSLYEKPDKKRVRDLQKQIDRKDSWISSIQKRKDELQRENYKLKQALASIHELSK